MRILARFKVLPDCLGLYATNGGEAEALVGPHPDGRFAVLGGPPPRRLVALPVDAVVESFGGRGQSLLATCDGHEAVLAGDVRLCLGLQQELPAGADEGPGMSERVGDAEVVAEDLDSGPQLHHGDEMRP